MGKIMTMGEILAEILATEPGQSFRKPGRLEGPYPSGAPAIFIDQVARLGHPAGIIGCVGDDDFGWLNIERLKRDGVDTSAIKVLNDAVTGSAFVTYGQTGERHFVFNIAQSASGQLSPSHVSEQRLEGCTHFHVMGSSLFAPPIREAMNKAIEIVKRQGGSISFDPNIRKEMLGISGMQQALTNILKQTDIFLPSGDELTLLVKATTEEGAVEELLALGIKEIVVKKGSQGCTYYDAANSDATRSNAPRTDTTLPNTTNVDAKRPNPTNVDAASPNATNVDATSPIATSVDASRADTTRTGSRSDATRRLTMPALRVKDLDPTGAGDCFAATYVTCRHQKMSVEQSLRYACASGARAVMSKGPMEGTASFADLDRLLAQCGVGREWPRLKLRNP